MAEQNSTSNDSGGCGVTDLHRVRRFLCLGTEFGTYTLDEKIKLGRENAESLVRLIHDGRGEEVVEEISKFSREGKAVKQQPLIFALALCARESDVKTKQTAYKALSKVCQTPTQLFAFVNYAETLSGQSTGWGRAQRRAVQAWYNEQEPRQLAHLVTKYRHREGWTHKDLLRLCHLKPTNQGVAVVIRYIVKGFESAEKEFDKEDASDDVKNVLTFLRAVEDVKNMRDEGSVAGLVEQHKLAKEHIPTQLLKSKEVWRALLQDMPMMSLLRCLGKLSAIGLLAPLNDQSQAVCERLTDEEQLKKALVHPLTLLTALKQYERGRGDKMKQKWVPDPQIMEALNTAFYNSFKNIEPTDKRILLAVDCGRSMAFSGVNGSSGLTAAMAAGAMAMCVARTEPNSHVFGFTDQLVQMNITTDMRLDQILQIVGATPKGRTDCVLPILYAKDNNIPVDMFLYLTDNKTGTGDIHPSEALKQYRAAMKTDARLCVCAMSSNSFTLADPEDAGMLDIIGLDSLALQVIRNFALGDI
ncbi:RNA-binding protein RO60-like [Branchiostoma lanceolatum]|uniref:RNA-binding protein RO60-like n=1 Tax=Branchiostoma lanceolatum TaxID=7740 RepID=UPI003456B28D